MTSLEYHRFGGSHVEIGRQHGEACADRIHQHLELALARLAAAGISRETALTRALGYRPFVQEHAEFLDQEIVGLAAGAGLGVDAAYLLQLRAEVAGHSGAADECTTFAALPAATRDGVALAGQNADLPAIYQGLMVVMHLQPEDGPEIMMATPAGQVSYIGISSDGMASFANFLECDGWRTGFPRYLLSRYALARRSVAAAVEGLRGLPRGSSRNLVLLDSHGAVDFENTPTRDALIEPVDGVIAHANHYLSPELADAERAGPRYLANSRTRQARIDALLAEHAGALAPKTIAAILRDRSDTPDALSVEAGDTGTDGEDADRSITVTSVIAEPAAGRIWVSAGPPSTADYVAYDLVGGRRDDETM